MILLSSVALSSVAMQWSYAEPIKRTILILYEDSEDTFPEAQYRYRRYVPVILNHLGLKVRYHNVEEGLPSETSLQDVRGIFTWFRDDSMKDPYRYLEWLEQKIESGIKVVIFGNIGAETEILDDIDPTTHLQKLKSVPSHVIEKTFRAMGLKYKGNFKSKTHLLKITYRDPTMMNFEKKIERDLKTYYQIISHHPRNHIYLKAHLMGRKTSETDLIITTPYGGFAAPETMLRLKKNSEALTGEAFTSKTSMPETTRNPDADDYKLWGWYLNPFHFFSEAFDLASLPKPDVTTLLGSRILYAHIDGDGFNNISHIDSKSLSAQFIYENILKKYKIPQTVSVIVGEMDEKLLGSPKTTELAKKIFALDYIEAASHGFGHPFNWKEKDVGLKLLTERFGYKVADYQKEIIYSTEWINKHLLSENKKVKIFLWTGECDPPAEAIKLPYDIGIKNINGGDSQFDVNVPTLLGLAPLTRMEGDQTQFFASQANENIFTNLWKGPFYGYRKIIETFKNTESPRRLSPLNIYYHFYSGERHASLQALKTVYEYALSQPVFPRFASQYVSTVEGFLSAVITKINDGWEISHFGDMRTLRFDGLDSFPDFKRSTGIIGFMHYQNALYIFLDDHLSPVRLFLTPHPPKQPYIAQSNVMVHHWKVTPSDIIFEAEGMVPASIKIRNIKSSQWVNVHIDHQTIPLKANASGTLSLQFNLRNVTKVTIPLK